MAGDRLSEQEQPKAQHNSTSQNSFISRETLSIGKIGGLTMQLRLVVLIATNQGESDVINRSFNQSNKIF